MYVCESYLLVVFIVKEVYKTMALKQGQETHSYVDGIHVKISENYKPPPRINPITTYTQRILHNKDIQDSIPSYDFTLETNLKVKMKELLNARQQIRKEKKQRLESVKEERQRLAEQEKRRVESEERELFIGANDTSVSNAKIINYNNMSDSINTFSDISHNNFITTSSRPTYSHILTPIPLKEPICTSVTSHLNDKSPLNISDFEADNSSPFDNVELKTINDLEELAQVLKNNESITNPYTQISHYGNYTPANTTIQPLSEPSSNYINYNPSFVTSTSSEMIYQQKFPYSTANGYYYPQVTMAYDYSKTDIYHQIPQTSVSNKTDNKQSVTSVSASYKSVPDIMRALQDELSNVKVSKTPVNRISCPESAIQSTKSFERQKENEEEKDETFMSLPANLKSLAQGVSSMGFPLSRVARVCVVIGEDQKKVVEHLLAMSELLDLGFPENEVSRALLKSDNDRDKALDILIS